VKTSRVFHSLVVVENTGFSHGRQYWHDLSRRAKMAAEKGAVKAILWRFHDCHK
jgi:hypothetical protein